MAENKTRATPGDVAAFIAAVPDDRRREDARELCALMEGATGDDPVLWGPSIVGFGAYHYRYDSGREGDAPLVAFSPRKAETVVYLDCDGARSAELLARLGPHRAGKSCVYIKRLSDIDREVLTDLVKASRDSILARYPPGA